MKCPNCGDNLIFDAKRQILVCRSCDSKFRIKDKTKAQHAEERSGFSDNGITLTRFTCASCGAELAGVYENSALGFCPYCGSESIISSRLNAKRPARLIPFSKTKQDCHEEYLQMVSKMPFVPDELKEEEFISEIRGIYIPYNLYHAKHCGMIDAEYGDSHGNTTDYYSLKGNVEADITIPVDASLQLDDNIGSMIFPYTPSAEEDFDEKYLATYYVELPDINSRPYITGLQSETMLAEERALECYSSGNSCELKNDEKENVKVISKSTVLSPAYFLTYKNEDRVCYTVIPGSKEGGIKYSEVPVDKRKYTLCMILMAGMIWAILSFIPFIPTFKHTVTMGIMSILAALAMPLQNLSYGRQQKRLEPFGGDKNGDRPTLKPMHIGLAFLIFFTCGPAIASGYFDIPAIIIALISYHFGKKIGDKYPQINTKASKMTLISVLIIAIATIISRIIFFPDEVVYVLMTFVAIPVVLCFITLINTFNESCTRPLPHFERQGGYNSAKDL